MADSTVDNSIDYGPHRIKSSGTPDNAATNSAAGLAESQAPSIRDGDRGVAPTASAPSAAPTQTPWTDAIAPHQNLSHRDIRHQARELRDFARSLERIVHQQQETLEMAENNAACGEPSWEIVEDKIRACRAAYARMKKEMERG